MARKKKKLNKNVVGVLSAFGFVVMTVAGIVMVRLLEQSDPRHFVELAEQAAAEGEWDKAKNYYLTAAQRGKDARYLVDAGEMFYQMGDARMALGHWQEAVTRDPSLVEAYERMIDMLLEFAEMYKQPSTWILVRDRAEQLLAVDSQHPKALHARGRALMEISEQESGNKRQGMEDIRRAADLAPENVDYALTLARLLLALGELDEAEAVMQRLRDAKGAPGEDAARVRYMYGRFLGAMGRHDEAVAMFQEAEEYAGGSAEARAAVKSRHGQYWVQRWYAALNSGDRSTADEHFDRAQRLLEESIQIYEKGFLPYMLLAEMLSFKGERLEAIRVCEQRITMPIDREGFRALERKYSRFLLLIRAADECLSHIAKLDRNSQEYDAYLKKAERFAADAAAEIPDQGHGLHTLGKIKLAQGKDLEAIQFLQRARVAYGKPDWQNSRLLARLLMSNNQPGEAKAVITDAIRDPKADPSCWVIYAQILLGTSEYALALQTADEALQRDPGNRDALRAKMTALQMLGRREEADRIAVSLAKNSPQDLLLQAQLLHGQDRSGEALRIAKRYLGQHPAAEGFVRLAVDVLLGQGQDAEAMQIVQNALAEKPDSIALQSLAIVADRNRSPQERADAQFELLKHIEDPFQRAYRLMTWHAQHDPDEDYWDLLVDVERRLGDPASSVDPVARGRYLRDVLERQFAWAAEHNRDLIEDIVTKAVKANVDGADGLTYRGRAHMLAKDPEAAMNAFKLALQKQPTDAQTLTFMGQCLMALDPPQVYEAQQRFERAIEANPNMGTAHKGLAAIANLRGDEGTYLQHLKQCARLLPNDAWVQERLLAEQEKETPLDGIQRREEIRRREPGNIDNLLALADLYHRTKQIDKADECYGAIVAQKDVPVRAILRASDFYRRIDRQPRALEVLETLVQRAQGKEEKARTVLLIANHWHLMGDEKRAEEALHRAAELSESLEVCSGFARFKDELGDLESAVEWYRRAIDKADEASSEHAAELRRNLIDVYFRLNDEQAAARAIEDYAARYPEDPKRHLMSSALNTIRGDIDAAIDALDHHLEKVPGNLTAMLQRARLYGAQGRWPLAINDLERIRSIDPAFQNYAARMLLADGYALVKNTTAAYEELESVLRNDPQARQAAIQLIEMYAKHERFTDSIRVCTSMTNRYPNEPVWPKNRGDIRMRLNDVQSALADYQAAASLSNNAPHYTAALLDAYVDAGQYEQGVDYFENQIPQEKRTPQVRARYAELLAHAGRRQEAVPVFLQALDDVGFANLNFIRLLANRIVTSCGDRAAVEPFESAQVPPELQRAKDHVVAMLLAHFELDDRAMAAIDALLQSTHTDDEKTMLLAARGNLLERSERWADAKRVYEQLLEIDDRNIIGLNNLAFLLTDKLGQPREAVPYARRASVLYPIVAVRDTLAWSYVQLGDYRKAIALLTKVLEGEPRYVPGIYHLAEAYRRNGDLENAQALLEGAQNLIAEGEGEPYAERVRKALLDVRKGVTAP